MLIFSLSVYAEKVDVFDNSDLQINQLIVYDDYPILGLLNVQNHAHSRMDDVKATAIIYDLDQRYSTTRFDVGSSDEVSRRLLTDESVMEAGEYWVRVTVSNDDMRRVKHRLLFID